MWPFGSEKQWVYCVVKTCYISLFVSLAFGEVWILFSGFLALLFSVFYVIHEFQKFLQRESAKKKMSKSTWRNCDHASMVNPNLALKDTTATLTPTIMTQWLLKPTNQETTTTSSMPFTRNHNQYTTRQVDDLSPHKESFIQYHVSPEIIHDSHGKIPLRKNTK